jgi:hypothetical protein
MGETVSFVRQSIPISQNLPIDRWVHGTLEDSAPSHLSENGHVFHLMFEITTKSRQGSGQSAELAKSA